VFVVTGNLWAALAQLVTHWMFDFVKCEGFTNPHMDQLMHTCVLVITASILSMPA
jgi:hypothetical protein